VQKSDCWRSIVVKGKDNYYWACQTAQRVKRGPKDEVRQAFRSILGLYYLWRAVKIAEANLERQRPINRNDASKYGETWVGRRWVAKRSGVEGRKYEIDEAWVRGLEIGQNFPALEKCSSKFGRRDLVFETSLWDWTQLSQGSIRTKNERARLGTQFVGWLAKPDLLDATKQRACAYGMRSRHEHQLLESSPFK